MSVTELEPAPAPLATSAPWGTARWGTNTWGQVTYPPGASWQDRWRFWYQYGQSAQSGWDITKLVVEAQWTSNGHSLGDGTFRGDLQPGTMQLRIWDPNGLMRGLSTRGAIWCWFKPTGACWCYFLRSTLGHLVAPGDPWSAELVLAGDSLPAQVTTSAYIVTLRPAESVNARLTWAVGAMSSDNNLRLPALSAAIAPDSHMLPAMVQDADGNNPPWLQILRDAAANGCLWLEPVGGADKTIPGTMVVHYDTWDTVNVRTLDSAQVVAATSWTISQEQVVTQTKWTGTRADGTTKDNLTTKSALWGPLGIQTMGPMRMWGDISSSGAQRAAVDATNTALFNVYAVADPNYVDQITMVSGDRAKADGTGAGIPWDPAAMVVRPLDRLDWARRAGQPVESYRVSSSSHDLTARTWTVTHTLERYVAATALP